MVQIRMKRDLSYPLDEHGNRVRTLPRGRVFNEDEGLAVAAVEDGYAEYVDSPASADGAEASTLAEAKMGGPEPKPEGAGSEDATSGADGEKAGPKAAKPRAESKKDSGGT